MEARDGFKCPSCRRQNPADAAFCSGCGMRLSTVCPTCQRSNPSDSAYCGGCGQRLTSGAVASVTPSPSGPAPAVPAALAAGRYRVKRFLGEGGKKRVYLAHDSRLERDVALALIRTEGLDETGLARVRREARAMGRLGDHPNIVTVYDVGEEAGQPYIVSQYMGGGSIDDLLQRAEKRRLPMEQTLRLAEDVCRALEYAHVRGVIHRDLKPGNIWLTEDGVAKLGDFGLAVALDRSRVTLEGLMVGTVAYMPPEQALGRAPDVRSDLYAFGAMLYEMVTGRAPFLGDDAVAVISQHINTPPVAPTWHNADVPRALETLVLRLLAKAPEERPESAAAVRETLAAITKAKAPSGEQAVAQEVNPLDRLASGIFVGREREMDELRAGFEDALSGHGRLLLLVGEPGIGKTRTAEELATYARLRKAQILWGRCYEGEGAPAYWPWVQAIRTYVHDREPSALLSEMGSGASEIAQVVSEVRQRLPGLPEPQRLDPEQARFRLFDSISTFLRNASGGQPLVLILDDLHWADKPSLLLLRFLARELRGARLLVLGTYRDVDLRRQHPLSQTLGELTREQLSQRILLRGLGEHDVERFIEITAGIKPPAALVEAVYKETEGNPFFVNEVVRLLVADGRLQRPEQVKSWSVGIPQSVREVVGRRLDHLSAECNRVLTAASVIGREFGVDVLEHMSDLSDDRLLEVLDEAVAARVVTEIPRAGGRYTFSHALIRETLYEELSATRRGRLHRRIGETLEQLYGAHPEPHLAELAYHFFEAAQGGDVDRAIGYAVRAGDRAAELMAHEEAARQYDLALQALELRPHNEAGKCAMLLTLSETLWRSGDYDRAKETALQAAELARRLGDAESVARAALDYGGTLPAFAAVVRDETLVALLEEALVVLPPGDNPLRARVLSRLAEEITFSDPYERREALCREAVGMARRLGDPAVLGSVLRSAHWALWIPHTSEERVTFANEVLDLGRKAGDRAMAVEGRIFLGWDLVEQGDIAGAIREIEEASRLSESLRQPYYRWGLAVTRVLLAFAQGRLPEVEALAQLALQMGQEAQNQNAPLVFGIQTALLQLEQGRTQEAEANLMGAAGMYPVLDRNIRCALALLYMNQGRAAEARAEFEGLAAHDFADLPRNSSWLYSLSYLAEVASFLGDVRRAETLYALLLPFARLNVIISPTGAWGSCARYLGLLAATKGRSDEAARHFEDALEMNARMGTKQAVAHTQADYAEMLLARNAPGDRTKGLDLLNQALDIAGELGMKLVVEKALALKLRAQGVTGDGLKTSIDAVAVAVEREQPDLRRLAAPDGTVTILFSDIENFTPMAERLGDQRAQAVLRRHNAIVRQQVAMHGGFEVKSQGDGFMLAFASARRALLCAIGMQRAFAAQAARHPDESVRVRIGLHTGEAIKEGDDFFGRNVILAARIGAQANGGEILASWLVKELTQSAGDIEFDAPRTTELKGLAGTYTLHRVSWSAAAAEMG